MRAVFVVVVLCLGLAPESRAQGSVLVEIGNNNRSIAVVPDEIHSLVVKSQYRLINVTNISSVDDSSLQFSISQDVDCGPTNCTINLDKDDFSSVAVVEFEFLTEDNVQKMQNLSLTIRQDLNATCKNYSIPQNFTKETMKYYFTCEPLPVNGTTVMNVVWRRFRNYTSLLEFQWSGAESEDAIILTGGNYTVEGNMNQTLIVKMAEAEYIAYYYVPSFVVQGSATQLATAETFINVGPTIKTPKPDFSLEVLFERRQFDEIRCVTESFPPAEVVWTLTSEDYPNGQDVSTITTGRFSLVDFGSLDDQELTFTINAIINMTNLQYDDDGNFSCIAMNEFGSSAQWVILRVKSPLRPLWPALGFLGVILIVTLFMSGSFMVEKVVERQKRGRITKSESNSSDHTSERGHKLSSISTARGNAHNGSKELSGHSSVKRLSSAKPLLEETTTTL